jgi:predicted dienelactone hydrolase
MRPLVLRIVLLVFVVLMPLHVQSPAEEPASGTDYDRPGPHAIKTLEFPDLKDSNRDERSVPLKVHFPVDGEAYRLVVMSHGGAGTWDANIYQAQHLASHGYVVVCTEHVYSNNVRVKYYMSHAGGRMRFYDALHRITTDPKAVLERPRDVSFAIDQAVAWNREHADLAGKIDTKRVAVMGHSFGAYTTFVVCGARPILDYLRPAVAPGKGLAGDLSDPRVTFGLAMSPQSPGTTFFGSDSYKTIDRPLMCLTGSRDVQKGFDGGLMPPHTRWQVLRLIPPGNKYFLWLENADQLCFSDNPKSYLLPSRARSDAQRISRAVMVLSWDLFLKGKQEARKKLNKDYINSLCGNVVTAVRWHEK